MLKNQYILVYGKKYKVLLDKCKILFYNCNVLMSDYLTKDSKNRRKCYGTRIFKPDRSR